MANIDMRCLNCGSSNLRVRTSQKVSLRTINVMLICNNCGSRNHVLAEVLKLETPIYNERQEALSINKPLIQVDLNQQDFFQNEDNSKT
ncbi:hypothetical protein CEP48_05075 [Mergibacter septicus]|uniref:Uncharacterized protein n=1 Tax=Mergibacter septicus TaxID=221402 RepID=A0A8E3MD50_9PAST|nr:hypothetical protein [Mergibacter septicus]AWX15582.1 hypothetical protein CEP47_05075 [Mergibacter septicus]QDJ13058.1 hypothetical protein CEP45_03970 [Mergibacter septicus]QDJ14836.1 hypothetical protein CEP48_05075 [Mergibacter septicus]UTU47736.1 hypothetical protein HLL31_02510 [Mergibacter septicus]WMR96658.1 hypothetical protein RDJ12_03625 [Mergibacter septicus]